jgi:5-methylthioadenosine/S-adenosylhomocysteine deaminase
MSVLIKNVFLNKEKKDIYIKDDKIFKIGNNLNLKVSEVIDAKSSKAVVPPLINSHTHSAMSLLRGYSDDLSLKEWLEKKIWPIEEKLTEDDIYWGVKLACLEMIKTGTVFFNDMYMFPEITIKAVKEMKIKALIGLVMVDVCPVPKDINYLEKIYKKLEKEQDDLVKLSVAPHAIYTVSDKNLVSARKFANKNNLIIHTHLSETKEEVDYSLNRYKLRPAQFLNKLKFFSGKTVLAHSVWLSDEEIEILSKNKCSVIYNPTSNLKLSVEKIFQYEKIKNSGINILIGTDGAASNNNLDMFEEMKFASLLQKYQEKKSMIASAEEIFKCATKNGYDAFNLESGEIKQGKKADLIFLDLNEVSLVPGFNLISDIVYSASGNVVSDFICNGKIIMRDKFIEHEKEIIEKSKKIMERYRNK